MASPANKRAKEEDWRIIGTAVHANIQPFRFRDVCVWECVFLMEVVFLSGCLLPKRLMSLSSRVEEHLRFPELTKKITAALLQHSILPAACRDLVGLTVDPSPRSLSAPLFLPYFSPTHKI